MNPRELYRSKCSSIVLQEDRFFFLQGSGEFASHSSFEIFRGQVATRGTLGEDTIEVRENFSEWGPRQGTSRMSIRERVYSRLQVSEIGTFFVRARSHYERGRIARGEGTIETRGPVSKLLLVHGDATGPRTRVIYATHRDSGDRVRRFSRERGEREGSGTPWSRASVEGAPVASPDGSFDGSADRQPSDEVQR